MLEQSKTSDEGINILKLPFLSVAEMLDSSLLALCGPNRVLDESTCDCICQNGLTEESCDPGWKLDHDTCKMLFH